VAVTDRGFINVDIQMRTKVHHLLAISDIVGRPMLRTDWDASNQLPQPVFVHMRAFCCGCKKRAATGVGTRSHQTGAIVSGLLFADCLLIGMPRHFLYRCRSFNGL